MIRRPPLRKGRVRDPANDQLFCLLIAHDGKHPVLAGEVCLTHLSAETAVLKACAVYQAGKIGDAGNGIFQYSSS